MRITFLGTGTSQGIPVIACKCSVCLSEDINDKRLRTSVLIEVEGVSIVIDTGPDFRQQMLRADVQHLDAVIYTHAHKDHIAGLDDVRPFNFINDMEMPIYGEKNVLEALKREFHYAFEDIKYLGVPRLALNEINNEEFYIKGIKIIPIRAFHYKLPVFGFRINDFTYITDANYIEDAEFEKIKNSKVLVLNALRKNKHISHFTLEEAIKVFEKSESEKGYFTHISHLMGKHKEINAELPENIRLASDELKINI